MVKLVIPIRPITKKNHQEIRINRGNGKHFVSPSPQYKLYEQECGWYLKEQYKENAIDYSVNVKCLYYMPTKGCVDLSNLLEATHDVLTKYGVLEDDNSKIIAAVDGSRVLHDRENPRTEIYIEKFEGDRYENHDNAM